MTPHFLVTSLNSHLIHPFCDLSVDFDLFRCLVSMLFNFIGVEVSENNFQFHLPFLPSFSCHFVLPVLCALDHLWSFVCITTCKCSSLLQSMWLHLAETCCLVGLMQTFTPILCKTCTERLTNEVHCHYNC